MRIKDLLEEKGSEVVTVDAGQTIHAAIVKYLKEKGAAE